MCTVQILGATVVEARMEFGQSADVSLLPPWRRQLFASGEATAAKTFYAANLGYMLANNALS